MPEFKKAMNHDIIIKPAINGGYIVWVGCAQACYSGNEKDRMVDDILEYLNHPEAVEKQYNNENRPQCYPSENVAATEGGPS